MRLNTVQGQLVGKIQEKRTKENVKEVSVLTLENKDEQQFMVYCYQFLTSKPETGEYNLAKLEAKRLSNALTNAGKGQKAIDIVRLVNQIIRTKVA